eukprot:RCo009764
MAVVRRAMTPPIRRSPLRGVLFGVLVVAALFLIYNRLLRLLQPSVGTAVAELDISQLGPSFLASPSAPTLPGALPNLVRRWPVASQPGKGEPHLTTAALDRKSVG